jgi:hypothetical protein
MTSDEFHEDLLMPDCFVVKMIWIEQSGDLRHGSPEHTIDELGALPLVVKQIEETT